MNNVCGCSFNELIYFCVQQKKPVISNLKVTKRAVRKKQSVPELNEIIISAIEDKKGEEIITLDLRKISDAPAEFFIICQADNTTQVKAIADYISYSTFNQMKEKPWHIERTNNMEWILIDYVNTVVHIFLDETRSFYQLEELWNDGVITKHNEIKTVVKSIKRK